MCGRQSGQVESLSGGVRGLKFFLPEEPDTTSWKVLYNGYLNILEPN